jgi:hypothetical protein
VASQAMELIVNCSENEFDSQLVYILHSRISWGSKENSKLVWMNMNHRLGFLHGDLPTSGLTRYSPLPKWRPHYSAPRGGAASWKAWLRRRMEGGEGRRMKTRKWYSAE